MGARRLFARRSAYGVRSSIFMCVTEGTVSPRRPRKQVHGIGAKILIEPRPYQVPTMMQFKQSLTLNETQVASLADKMSAHVHSKTMQ